MYQYTVTYSENGVEQTRFTMQEGQSVQWAVPMHNGIITVYASGSMSSGLTPSPGYTPDYSSVLNRIADRLDRDAETFKAAWEREPELPYFQAKCEVLEAELVRLHSEIATHHCGGEDRSSQAS